MMMVMEDVMMMMMMEDDDDGWYGVMMMMDGDDVIFQGWWYKLIVWALRVRIIQSLSLNICSPLWRMTPFSPLRHFVLFNLYT